MASAIKSLYEAKTQLSSLIERASRGEEIVIAKNGKPMAKLVPLEKKRAKRKPGGWKGKVWIAENFDAPLPELEALFEEATLEPPRRT